MFAPIMLLVLVLLIDSVMLGLLGIMLAKKIKPAAKTGFIIMIIFLIIVLQELLAAPLISYADLRIGNAELAELLGTSNVTNLVGASLFGFVLYALQAAIGYYLARTLYRKLSI